MLLSYFAIAYRHLIKYKLFSFINVAGLAVGMASAFFIIQYLAFEEAFDQFHENKNELFRVTYEQHKVRNTSAGTFYGVADFMKDNFLEVDKVVRFYKWPANTGLLFMAGNKIFNERNYFLAEGSFFEVFPSLLVQGNPSTCLTDPNAVVISERLAMNMFGTTDVVGKTMIYMARRNQEVLVTGVMKNIPENSHFDLDVVRPFDKDWIPPVETHWQYFGWLTYATLKKGSSVKDFENTLNIALKKSQKDNIHYRDVYTPLQKITDIHSYSHLDRGELKGNGNINVIYIVKGAFFAILLIAWINYLNLETARFITRFKEVGVRRIIGSSRWDLVVQFFIQYFSTNTLAVMLAGIIVFTSLPYFQSITGVPLGPIQLSMSPLWVTAFSVFAAGTVFTGIYPAFVLIRTNPVAALKGNLPGIGGGVTLRKSLLIFQFVSSIVLIGFLLIIFEQQRFMRETNSNINLDRILTVYNPTNYSGYEDSLRKERNDVFRNNLLQNQSIANLTTSSAIPGEPVGFTYVDLAKRSLFDPDRQIPYKVIYVDYDFIPIFNLKLMAGRNYSAASSDHNCIIVTESTVRNLGFTSAEEALNKEIYFMEDDWDKWRIIGVVEDYRHESLKRPIYPTIFRLHQNKGQMVYYSTLLSPGSNATDAVAAVKNAWEQTWPEKPFNYFFLDNYYDQQYRSEIYFGRIFGLFAVIAVFIACLGILGMTLFEVNARIREISVRKVLGASIPNLVKLLSRRNFQLIVVSGVISVPVIYFIASEWLGNYPLKVPISWWDFVFPMAVMVAILALASGYQTIKVTRTNPVDNLKEE